MSMKNASKSKKKIDHCASVAKDLGEMIRFSCNDEFRQKCMSMCKVSSTIECQEVIRKKLMEITIEYESMRENSKGRKRKATSKSVDSQFTIQEAFERQKRLELPERANNLLTINSMPLLESNSNGKRTLKQQPITDMFKKQKRIQHFNSVPLKPMISGQENGGIFGPQWQGIPSKTSRMKYSSLMGQSLLDPNNFVWNNNNNNNNNESMNPTFNREAKSMTSFHENNDTLSIMSDPRIFMWKEN